MASRDEGIVYLKLETRRIDGKVLSHPIPMKLAATVLRLLFGFLWLWAGIVKIKDPIAFSMEIRNYELIGDPLVAMAALLLPPLEIVCSLAVIFRKATPGALAILTGSLLVFTIAILISWARGLDISCGCFSLGGDSINYPVKVAENIALLTVGTWLWRLESRAPTGPTKDAPEDSTPSPVGSA